MADGNSNQLRVRLVTPDQILIDQSADAVELPVEVRLHGSAAGACAAAGAARFRRGAPARGRGWGAALPRVMGLRRSASRPGHHPRGRARKPEEIDYGRSTEGARRRRTSCGTRPAKMPASTRRPTRSSTTPNRNSKARATRAEIVQPDLENQAWAALFDPLRSLPQYWEARPVSLPKLFFFPGKFPPFSATLF